MTSDTATRDLLIALNAAETLARAAICRLAQEPERWAGRRDVAAGSGAEGELAAHLGVPLAQLRKARALEPAAAELAGVELERAARLGATVITCRDPDYPPMLRDLQLPPPVLYLQGRLPDGPAVAIVGSRRAQPYGREAAAYFARSLAEAGITVVSGFAVGVDAAAHRAALEVASGTTVAVLGCGLGVDYPQHRDALRQATVARGALLSEFPCEHLPRPWSFPIRNRVIAALAAGTLVVQAAARSGSLITAHHALELGRDVFAVPGSIFDDGWVGPNALIRDGALLAQHPRDITDALGLTRSAPRQQELFAPPEVAEPAAAATSTERPLPAGLAGRLLELLPAGAELSPDQLAARCASPMDQLLGALLELELAGWVRRQPGPTYRRS